MCTRRTFLVHIMYITDIEIDEPPPIYDRDTKNKAEELDRLHAAMKEKLVTPSNTERLQILTLVPDSWSQKYCSEYFGVSEYLIQSARELRQRKGILAQPSQKKGKAMAQETIDLVHAFYEGDEYSRQLPRKKDYVSIQKGVHKQKQLVLCNLHELFVALKERNPDVKIEFSKFCTLPPKWCAIAGSSGTHSVCVCTTHQNTILFVDGLNWEVTYKDIVNKVVCDPSNCECIMHCCTNCPVTNALHKFLEEELTDIDPDFQFDYLQWQTTDRASLVTVISTCEEYRDILISAINAITKHLFLAKCQANFLRAKKESLKANGVIVLGDFTENYQFV